MTCLAVRSSTASVVIIINKHHHHQQQKQQQHQQRASQHNISTASPSASPSFLIRSFVIARVCVTHRQYGY